MPTRRKVTVGWKICPNCGEEKELAEFNGGYCIGCARLYKKQWDAKKYQDEVHALQWLMIAGYGGLCGRCVGSDILPAALKIYPAEGDRRKLMRRLVDEGCPEGYMMVCPPCEAILGACNDP